MAKPRSAKGRRRRRCTASSGEQAPDGRRPGAVEGGFVHDVHYPAWVWPTTHPPSRPARQACSIGFLGPEGTFTEEALLSEPAYASAPTSPRSGRWSRSSSRSGRVTVDLGFVPLENAIEGTVRDIIDSLVFDFDLRIQREVVLDIHLHLMAPPGTDPGRRSSGSPRSPWPPPSAGGS